VLFITIFCSLFLAVLGLKSVPCRCSTTWGTYSAPGYCSSWHWVLICHN
jgi:hypothetical protein